MKIGRKKVEPNFELQKGFKFIPEFEGYYSISKNGEVYSHRLNAFLKPYVGKLGYLMTLLYKDDRTKRKHYTIHRLVATTYISNRKNLTDVNHIDGNKANNHVSNLEWVTHQQNMQHARNAGLYDESIYFRDWINWSPVQLAEFEQSPYNIPACGNYNYPADLKTSIDDITAAEKLAVSF